MNEDLESNAERPGWRHLMAVPTQYEAHLLEGFLESQGVRVELESKFFSQDPLSTGALGNIHLWVLTEDIERASKLVDEGLPVESDEGEGPEDSQELSSGALNPE